MCYLLAKQIDAIGCVALKTKLGKHLVNFTESLVEKVGYDKVELIVISRPAAYGEYTPYRFVETEEEFEQAVMEIFMNAS